MRNARIIIAAVMLAHGTMCLAQDAGDIFTQVVAGRLATGSAAVDLGMVTMGARIYTETFDSTFAVNNLGWNSLGSGSPALPPGVGPLLPDTDLEWDYMPMKIDGAVSNLFYWDGTGDVEFGSLPGAGYEFAMEAESGNYPLIYGTPELIPGEVVDDTDSLGGIHVHRFWYLDDGDGSLATDPADGVYLASLRTRMAGLDRSAPFYMVFRTLSTDPNDLTSAVSWAEDREADLTPDFAADFDGDLDVDGRDFLIWQRGFGTTGGAALQGAGDANFDSTIDAADLVVWESEYGSSLATFAGAAHSITLVAMHVPEPGAQVLWTFGTIAASLRLAGRRSVRSRLL